ncbi:hypothetical protein [Azospirillum endophyticum]
MAFGLRRPSSRPGRSTVLRLFNRRARRSFHTGRSSRLANPVARRPMRFVRGAALVQRNGRSILAGGISE